MSKYKREAAAFLPVFYQKLLQKIPFNSIIYKAEKYYIERKIV